MNVIVQEDVCTGLYIKDRKEVESLKKLGFKGMYKKSGLVDELYFLESCEVNLNEKQIMELLELTKKTAIELNVCCGDIFVN